MNNPLIQWPRAKYWTNCFNPIIGCVKCSPACKNCYAERVVSRWNMTGCDTPGFKPTYKPKAKMPNNGVVFCGNMTDLFGDWVNYQELDSWMHLMWRKGEHDGSEVRKPAHYLWLTKRVTRMADYLNSSRNIHGDAGFFGMTAENQDLYDLRLAFFCDAFGYKRKGWLSAEPLLGPIDLGLSRLTTEEIPFKWVVVGSESGPERRECRIEWIESIVNQCYFKGIPVFVKQIELNGRCETDIAKFPEHLQIRQVPWDFRINK